MNRSAIGLAEIADFHTLAAAFRAAARGKRGRHDVEMFRVNLEQELLGLRTDLLTGQYTPGPMRRFRIRDPKPRIIHAPCFRDRVLHHAIMANAGPVLDRALISDTYACRAGKGTLAAVRRAAHHNARHQWFGQIDVRAYFANIGHATLLRMLAGKFKNPALLKLFGRIIGAYEVSPGRGLPIGTLTSQHFANFYLSGLDRFILGSGKVRGYVRYMDDLVWWTADYASARDVLCTATAYLEDRLGLFAKTPMRIGRGVIGLNFCGFRIVRGRLLLSRRRKRRYGLLRRRAENMWLKCGLSAAGLQSMFASVLALTVHADAVAWRREQMVRRPLDPVLADL